jgi:hypothetical protein
MDNPMIDQEPKSVNDVDEHPFPWMLEPLPVNPRLPLSRYNTKVLKRWTVRLSLQMGICSAFWAHAGRESVRATWFSRKADAMNLRADILRVLYRRGCISLGERLDLSEHVQQGLKIGRMLVGMRQKQ